MKKVKTKARRNHCLRISRGRFGGRKSSKKRAREQRKKMITSAKEETYTGYAGGMPFLRYTMDNRRLRQRAEGCIQIRKGKNSQFTEVDVVMNIFGLYAMGHDRISQLNDLADEVICAEELGLEYFCSEDVARDGYKKATQGDIQRLRGVRQEMVLEFVKERDEQAKRKRWIKVDLDVTGIEQRAEKREGVEPGYCNGKLTPCLREPRVTIDKLVYKSDLRRGSDNSNDFFSEAMNTIGDIRNYGIKGDILYREDNQFTSTENLDELIKLSKSDINFHFVVCVPSRCFAIEKALRKPGIRDRKNWLKIGTDDRILNLGEVEAFKGSTEKCKLSLVEQLIKEKSPRSHKKKSSSVKRKERKRKKIRYYGIAYTPYLPRKSIFHLYHDKTNTIEFSFKNGKQAKLTDKFPAQKLKANRFIQAIQSIVYNLYGMFQKDALSKDLENAFIPTVRKKVIKIGGENRSR